jgi:hypothetical protein
VHSCKVTHHHGLLVQSAVSIVGCSDALQTSNPLIDLSHPNKKSALANDNSTSHYFVHAMTVRFLWNYFFPSASSSDRYFRIALFSKQRKNICLSIRGAILAMYLLRSAFCHDGFSSIQQYRHHIMKARKIASTFANGKCNSFIQQRTFAPYHILSQRHRRQPSLSLCSAFVSFPSSTQALFSTKTKARAATAPSNRWKSPVLRSNSRPSEKTRPPRLFKRTHLKVQQEDDLSDEKLYRADRVLSNRTGKSRKECFQLLQERRVFILTDEIYTDPKGDLSRKSLRSGSTASVDETSSNSTANKIQQYRLEVITGPSVKLSMRTPLRIDKYQEVALPPPLLMVYHKPKVN